MREPLKLVSEALAYSPRRLRRDGAVILRHGVLPLTRRRHCVYSRGNSGSGEARFVLLRVERPRRRPGGGFFDIRWTHEVRRARGGRALTLAGHLFGWVFILAEERRTALKPVRRILRAHARLLVQTHEPTQRLHHQGLIRPQTRKLPRPLDSFSSRSILVNAHSSSRGSRHITSVKMYTDDAPNICPSPADI